MKRSHRGRSSLRRAVLTAVTVGWVVVLGACFENPVRRVLNLRFAGDGGLELGLRIDLVRRDFASEAMKRRLAAEEELLLSADDPWRRRFEALAARADDMSRHREGGLLTRLIRRADVDHSRLLEEDGALTAFWAGTSIFPSYTYDPVARVAELALFPGKAQGAGYREQRLVEDKIDRWSVAIYSYLQGMEALYAYLERYPERAGVVFAAFGDELETDGPGAPTEEETRQLDALSDAMTAVLAPFENVDDRDAETWDELSRRVFDPFAARLVVEVPGRPFDVEGFVEQGGRLVIPGMSLWAAWQELTEAWVSPNLLMIMVDVEQEFGGLGDLQEASSGGEVQVDFADLATRPRRVDMPFDAAEVADAIRSWLRPEPVYRVRWHLEAPADDDSAP